MSSVRLNHEICIYLAFQDILGDHLRWVKSNRRSPRLAFIAFAPRHVGSDNGRPRKVKNTRLVAEDVDTQMSVAISAWKHIEISKTMVLTCIYTMYAAQNTR
jgi:hypothetical protein